MDSKTITSTVTDIFTLSGKFSRLETEYILKHQDEELVVFFKASFDPETTRIGKIVKKDEDWFVIGEKEYSLDELDWCRLQILG